MNGFWDDESAAVRVEAPVVVFGDHTQVIKLVDFDFVVGADGVKILKPKQFLLAPFLRYFLEANPVPSKGYARHFRHLSELPVPLPSEDEQKRIVAVLDQAFAALDRARAHAEANLADADRLLLQIAESELLSLGRAGRYTPVSEIADHCLGKMLDKKKNKGSLRPYLRNLNVRWFEIDESDVLEMRIEEKEADRYSVERGDLLICEGGYPGRASIYDSNREVYFQKALHRVRFSDPSLAKILMYWLFAQDKLGKLKQHFTGTGISHFTGKSLAAFQMPIGNRETNKNVAAAIDRALNRTRGLSIAYEAQLNELADLRQSLLQKAFSGQLI